jgi:hypothetical protein
MGDRQFQDDRATRIRTIIGQKHQPEQHRANIEQKYRESIEQYFTIDGTERKATDACEEYLALLEQMVAKFKAEGTDDAEHSRT